MLKSFIRDALIYTLPTVLSRGISIFLLPIYTSIASPEEIGALDMFLLFGNIVALTVALEISQAIARYIPELSDVKARIAHSSSGLFFTVFMYLLFFILSFIFSEELNQFVTGITKYKYLFQLALIYIALNGFYYYFQNLLRFEGNSFGYSILSVSYASLNLISAYILGVVYNYGVEGILFSMIISVLLCSIFGFFLLMKSFKMVIDITVLKKLLKFSITLVPASILVFVSLYVDRYMISQFLDLENVGQYGVAFRLASAASLVLIGFQMAITPLVYKHYNEPNTTRDLAIIFKYFVIFSVIFFLVYSLIAEELLILLTTPDFYLVANVIPILVLSLLFSNMYVFMPGISIRKKTYLIFFISIFSSVVNVVLNYFFIPIYGISGAAYSTAFGYFLSFLIFVHLSQKLYYVPHKWTGLLFIFAVALALVYFYYNALIEVVYFQTVLVRLLIFFILIGFIFKLRLISPNEISIIRNTIKNKLNG